MTAYFRLYECTKDDSTRDRYLFQSDCLEEVELVKEEFELNNTEENLVYHIDTIIIK